MAGRHRPHVERRARLRPQVEHGLDARHPAVHPRETRCTARTTTTTSRSRSSTRSARTSCCRSATTRSCTARARCSARCRATSGRSSRTCARTSRSCGRTPASSCCSWVGVRAALGVERSSAGSTGGSSTSRPTSQLRRVVGALNRHVPAHPALWQHDDDASGFEWLEGGAAAENVIAFLRVDRDRRPLLCVVNFGGNPSGPYRLGLPTAGRWDEVLNTDAAEYGGSGVGNLGGVEATETPWDGRPASASSRCRRSRRCGSPSTPDPGNRARLVGGAVAAVQYSRFVRRRRAATTRGSSVPTISKNSMSRSRTRFLPSASSVGNSSSRRSNASST